jgi:hypothetical protein
MSAAVIASMRGDPAAIFDRHAVRRTTGVPTVSLLVGPIVSALRIWRRWAAGAGRCVIVAHRQLFPLGEWVRSFAENIDLPNAAIGCLAERAQRDAKEFLIAWQTKTPADRERFWTNLTPTADDDLLRLVADLPVGSGIECAGSLSDLGEPIVPVVAGLAPSSRWPTVLWVAGSVEDLLSIGDVAVNWAMRLPALPIAVAVPARVWDEYAATAPESRAKALLGEGEVAVPVIDEPLIEQTLAQAGAMGSGAAIVAANGADSALLESAVAAARATAAPPATRSDDDRARSAAERFLFTFLESVPETAGRFELNAALDFGFGPRPAEVDLLCRSPRIAIELDGYFHFLASDDYRRDRAKDWELQRRGFIVLRFLAEDVIPQLEVIRDRILDALAGTPLGADP